MNFFHLTKVMAGDIGADGPPAKRIGNHCPHCTLPEECLATPLQALGQFYIVLTCTTLFPKYDLKIKMCCIGMKGVHLIISAVFKSL